MIFENAIEKYLEPKFPSELELMQEYYENEIFF